MPKTYISFPDAPTVDASEAVLPDTARLFRDAWSGMAGSKVVVDMPKAKELQKDRIRQDRKPHLESLDVAFNRALETDDDAENTAIAALKRKARDVTDDPRIDAATTDTELAALTYERLME